MSLSTHDPYANYRELTLRGMILGALITVVFTASNIYLGLKVGLCLFHPGCRDFHANFEFRER